MQPDKTSNDINEFISRFRMLGNIICDELNNEIDRIELGGALVNTISYEQLEFSLSRDPYSQQDSLLGTWYDAKHNKLGSLVFHADDSFFAEYDVLQAHPAKHGWFVEAVSAWGNPQGIKTESRLLSMPE